MDFFNQEAHAQRQTKLLVWLFGLAVLAVVILTYLILATAIQVFRNPFPDELSLPGLLRWLWDAKLVSWITLGSLVSIGLGSLYKTRQLSAGGPAVAELLGGRCVEPGTSDLAEQRLRHVLEEMAIAS